MNETINQQGYLLAIETMHNKAMEHPPSARDYIYIDITFHNFLCDMMLIYADIVVYKIYKKVPDFKDIQLTW
jgi:hypothetical protein